MGQYSDPGMIEGDDNMSGNARTSEARNGKDMTLRVTILRDEQNGSAIGIVPRADGTRSEVVRVAIRDADPDIPVLYRGMSLDISGHVSKGEDGYLLTALRNGIRRDEGGRVVYQEVPEESLHPYDSLLVSIGRTGPDKGNPGNRKECLIEGAADRCQHGREQGIRGKHRESASSCGYLQGQSG